MTDAVTKQNGAEPEQNDAPLKPRVQQVADILGEVFAREMRESGTKPEQS